MMSVRILFRRGKSVQGGSNSLQDGKNPYKKIIMLLGRIEFPTRGKNLGKEAGILTRRK